MFVVVVVRSFSGSHTAVRANFDNYKIFTAMAKEQRNYSAAIVGHFIVKVKDIAVVNEVTDDFYFYF